jgi:hypothetical protein
MAQRCRQFSGHEIDIFPEELLIVPYLVLRIVFFEIRWILSCIFLEKFAEVGNVFKAQIVSDFLN